MCDFNTRNDIKHLIYLFFYHIYVSMYLFYVEYGLDIKKIGKNEYFCTKLFFSFFLDFSDFLTTIKKSMQFSFSWA